MTAIPLSLVALIRTGPPAGLYLIALVSKFSQTNRVRLRSAMTKGKSGAIRSSKVMSCCAACGTMRVHVCSMSSKIDHVDSSSGIALS